MYRFHNSGGGHAVSFVSQPEKGYPTEKEAVYAALLRLEHDANRELSDCSHDRDTDEEDGGMKNSSAAPYIRSALKQIEEYKQLFNPQQLSLFE